MGGRECVYIYIYVCMYVCIHIADALCCTAKAKMTL